MPDGPQCGEGHAGCLEGVASGTAIARRARELLAAGERSSLAGLAEDDLDAHAVGDAAAHGDAMSIRLYAEAGRALGLAIGSQVNLLSPEVVVVGGGLINSGDLLFAPLHAGVREIAFAAPLQRCRIVPAALGTDAGLVGAVAWAVRRFAARTQVASTG
jgi:glucokinase